MAKGYDNEMIRNNFNRIRVDGHNLEIGTLVYLDSPNKEFYLNGTTCEIVDYLVKIRDSLLCYQIKIVDLNGTTRCGPSMLGTYHEVRHISVHPMNNKGFKHLLRK